MDECVGEEECRKISCASMEHTARLHVKIEELKIFVEIEKGWKENRAKLCSKRRRRKEAQNGLAWEGR